MDFFRENVDIAELRRRLLDVGYAADEGLATALACAVGLTRPLLLEGEAGVGKTDAARALADVFGARLIRLQCYEGLDLAGAAYEWNYGKQLLAIRAAESRRDALPDLYAPTFLIRRPLLAALGATRPREIVLLIDEIDRADDDFEAFLLEFLSDFAITIPEIEERSVAAFPPLVVLTSNRTRDLHDALKRRCFYSWIEHPTIEREIAILRLHLGDASGGLLAEVARATAALRELGLRKPPGIAESLDWARTLSFLGAPELDRTAFERSLGAVVKYPEDVDLARAAADAIVTAAREPG